MASPKNTERGMALPMALVMLVLASLVVVPSLIAIQSLMTINSKVSQNTLAQYAAEAGIADVVWRLKQTGSAPGFPYSPSNMNGMTVTLDLAKTPTSVGNTTSYAIKSTAKTSAGTALSTIYTTIDVKDTGAGAGAYPFQYAVASTGGDIHVDKGTVKSDPAGQGDVFANGKLTIGDTGSVLGKWNYTTDPPPTGCVSPNCQKVRPVTFAEMDESWYMAERDKGKTRSDCPYNINGGTFGQYPTNTNYSYFKTCLLKLSGTIVLKGDPIQKKGVVWVDGDIDMSGVTISGDPTYQYYIFAHGTASQPSDIKVEQKSSLGGNIILIADYGNIEIANNTDTATLYAPHGNIKLDGNGNTYGAVLGKTVEISQPNRNIIFPLSMKSTAFPGFIIGGPTGKVVTVTGYSGQ